MAMVDPFTPDAFKMTSLTEAINAIPYVPQRIGALGFFDEKGIASVLTAVEERDGVLSLASVRPRGGPGGPVAHETRKVIPFKVPHIPVVDKLLADEVQGVRVFGSESQAESVQVVLNERLALMRQALDYTLEVHRVEALKGNYYDANGDTKSLFTTFGVSQNTEALGLHITNSSSIRKKMRSVIGKVKTALGATPYRGLRVLCSSDFWDALVEDKDTKATYLNQISANELRGDPTAAFTAFGATWEWYVGTTDASFGSDAYLIPEGVPGLCITRFAPAPYIETVNTLGLPMYAKSEPLPMGKGYMIEAQSNPLNLVTRPAAIVKLTI